MPLRIVDDEQRRDRPQAPSARRVAPTAQHLRRGGSSPMLPHRLRSSAWRLLLCRRNEMMRIPDSGH
jgi:hypothetical protein